MPTLTTLGRYAQAVTLAREILALREKPLPPHHWLLASSRSTLGAHLVLAQPFAEAEPLKMRKN